MLTHYIKTALRNFWRNKLYTAINIIGLSTAASFAVLALSFAGRELNMDAFHDKADRLFRLYRLQETAEGPSKSAYTSGALGPALQAGMPEVVRSTRVLWNACQVKMPGGQEMRSDMTFVDPAFLQMFSFPLAYGDGTTALDDPYGVVLKAATAQRLFGTAAVVGRTLRLQLPGADQYRDFTVTGVLEPVAGHTNFVLDILVPFETPDTFFAGRRAQWATKYFSTFVELAPGAARVAAKVEWVYPLGADPEDTTVALVLQQLDEAYLDESIETEAGVTTPLFAYMFVSLAVVVLLIACINFANLAVGLSAGRALEVAVRKVSGAGRARLMGQFWAESVLLCLVAVGVGVLLAEPLLPLFNTLIDKPLTLNLDLETAAHLLGLGLVTGLVAGAYPALVLARLAPVRILNRSLRLGGSGWGSRLLVGFQFTVSIMLLISLLIARAQVDYQFGKDLGFHADQVAALWLPVDAADPAGSTALFERFRARVMGLPGIAGVTASSSWADNTESEEILGRSQAVARIDRRFFATIGLEMAAGRSFADRVADDNNATIINETAARRYKLQIGDRIEGYDSEPVVVGIVRDYHFQPLWAALKPQFFFAGNDYPMPYVLVRLGTDDVAAAVAGLRQAWGDVFPEQPFNLRFADEQYRAAIAGYTQFPRLIGWAVGLALILAAMGVYGLASLAVARRTKEVGVRKVLGASTGSVVRLFNREVTWLVGAAGAVACPLAWLYAQSNLISSLYPIEVGPGYFIVGVGAVLVLAWLTVSVQALRAALADPVQSLRYE